MRKRPIRNHLFTIPLGDIELHVYGRDKVITPRDIELMRKAVDMIEETMFANLQVEAEEAENNYEPIATDETPVVG